MKLKKNPYVLEIPISWGFRLLVNPLKYLARMLVSQQQFAFWQALSDDMTTAEAAASAQITPAVAQILTDKMLKLGLLAPEDEKRFAKLRGDPQQLDVWVHTTNSCTLDCSYCYIKKSPEHMSLPVMERFAEELIATAAKRRLKTIKLRLAGGEPFMRFAIWKPFLVELKAELAKHHCRLEISFISNLTILTDEIVDFLKQYRCHLSVSLDGLAASHDLTRYYPGGGGSFDRVTHNMDRLIEAGIKPYVLIVVSGANVAGLPALTEFLLAKDLGFRYSLVKGEALDHEKLRLSLAECYRLIGLAITGGYRFADRHRLCDINFDGSAVKPCASGRSSCLIDIDGSLHLCGYARSLDRPIGKLSNTGDLLATINDQTQFPQLESTGECLDCPYRRLCASGCPLDRVDGKSPYCQIFQEFIPVVLGLMGQEEVVAMFKVKK